MVARSSRVVALAAVLSALAPAAAAHAARLRFTRATAPAGTLVTDRSTGAWLATFTDGARTVTLAGPARRFGEATTRATVRSTTWVRLLGAPFRGRVDRRWLARELADRSPDVLALGMQYVTGAPSRSDASGLRIAGDADYGPLQPDGTREEGSDFDDYLGIPWTFGTSVDQPEATQHGALDCSGFVRIVFGYRAGLPLTLRPNGVALPRRAFEQYASAPGRVLVRDRGRRVASLRALAPGDLVFFDAATDDGTQIDHVGIYLGVDSLGHRRFLSSRKSANGPTLGDLAGPSILDGAGLYARSFRAVRRL
jgi:cell wall-associated NlpC family hydrolase